MKLEQFLWALGLCAGLVVGCGSSAGSTGSGGTSTLDGGGTGGTGSVGRDLCDCAVGEECDEQGECVSICGAVAACVQGTNATCCPSGSLCDEGACVTDCGSDIACGGQCCNSASEMCFDGACAAQCEDTNKLCGDSNQLCCGSSEACIQEQCIPLGPPCDPSDPLDLTCDANEFCELSTSTCVSRDLVDVCEFRPPVGIFTPTVACRWTPPAAAPGASAEEIEIAKMSDVVMTPAVLNLTDDNGDGKTDTLDMPDIVFISFNRKDNGCCTPRGVVRVISGGCNVDGTMTTHATLKGNPRPGYVEEDGFIGNSSGVALANLHPDTNAAERAPEIVATFRGGGAIAWRRTADDGSAWEILWQNDELPTNNHTMGPVIGEFWGYGGAQPAIADLNGDGQPEVIIGNVVLNGLTGAKVWDGLDLEVGDKNLGIGNNAFVGPVSAIADINLDGKQEVIAGNTVYSHTGAELWTYDFATSNSTCGGELDCDGFNAVGNFDADPEGEVVIVREGEVFVLNHDGSLLHQVQVPLIDTEPFFWPLDFVPTGPLFIDAEQTPPTPTLVGCGAAIFSNAYDSEGNQVTVTYPGGDPINVIIVHGNVSEANESGPPTVADFDGDGFAEIGTASSTAYVVIDFQCVGDPLPADCEQEFIRWMVPNDDCSSRATGSSVFDFEGDGAAEVVYADETTFRIFSGLDGTILYEDDTHDSNTRVEMPIVVDVDNDGKSEVVIPEPNVEYEGEPVLGGIEIWEDVENNWVRTRRVWNQHSYNVTNITEDGQIPRVPEINWSNSRLNNFRQNVQPGGLFDAPDFVVRSVHKKPCTASSTDITIVVGNDGALSVRPGIKVFVELTGSVTEEYVLETSDWLLPGQSEVLDLEVPAPGSSSFTVSVTVDEDGEGNGQYNECFEDNNTLTSTPITACGVQ